MDAIEALRAELASPEGTGTDALMAQVTNAKSSSFVCLLDADGAVLDANPAALIAGGLERTEVVGLPLWAAPWWTGTGADTLRMLKESLRSATRGRFVRFDIDIRLAGAEVAAETLDLMLRPLRGRDGIVAFIVAEGRSIGDRKRIEQRLARNNSELSALTERLARVHNYRERLLGELSHDLRAPLQVVVTRAEQVLRSQPDDELRSQVAGMRFAALDALEQVNDMLEQVKADHGEARLTLVDADLAQALRTVVEQFQPLVADRGLELIVDAPEMVPARFDIERVSRVISNLLANSIRHTPPEGVIRCTLRAGDAAAALEIADSGPGVPPDQREKVFGPYSSGGNGDGRSGGAGAGLGLAIVSEFVELHGGDVSLGDAPEGGALFVVTLPLSPPHGSASPATLSQHVAAAQRTQYVRAHLEAELAGAPKQTAVPTVVIVERVPGRAEEIVTGIGEDAVTCVAADAEEALTVAVELRPSAVVVGTATGDYSPPWLLRRLASDPRLLSARRIALAGEREQDPTPEALLAAGAQVVLPAAAAQELGGRLLAALGRSG
ncbi:PAS domain-containing protein [Solirubrobacter sp. CPCC 204708]|uniref:histidine kinase n=1 Tax=Solirubrobacter deserti TaxID=2282478 RepID=A0ABT4RIJ7_9ACTN|nr:PAS domain-containing sensor histidine kinase [Solirubrobacter deserti]MBE2320225.1 PAS domain-containing protein [Solirubrobacter deserti]MDA0138389.1 PAS domain-containing sensor histidine kinase [Solirubrobacter deserti]